MIEIWKPPASATEDERTNRVPTSNAVLDRMESMIADVATESSTGERDERAVLPDDLTPEISLRFAMRDTSATGDEHQTLVAARAPEKRAERQRRQEIAELEGLEVEHIEVVAIQKERATSDPGDIHLELVQRFEVGPPCGRELAPESLPIGDDERVVVTTHEKSSIR